jgi:hypothetical protein
MEFSPGDLSPVISLWGEAALVKDGWGERKCCGGGCGMVMGMRGAQHGHPPLSFLGVPSGGCGRLAM